MGNPSINLDASDPSPDAHRRAFRLARRVVIKVGTPVITHCDGNLALGRIGALVEQIAKLRQEGRDAIVVTSGAISTGALRMRKSMTLKSSLQSTIHQQPTADMDNSAASAVGQSLLMNMYETLFSKYNLSAAQVLLTEDDAKNPETMSHICETTMELMQLGTIPIINDNDAVTGRSMPVYDEATNEVRFDNDVLASRLAIGLRADLLVILTDLDALYVEPPSGAVSSDPVRLPVFNPEAKLVRSGINSGLLLLSDNGRGEFAGRTRMASEGMQALVDAARSAVEEGAVRAAVVTTGHHPLSLVNVLKGEDIGTLFIANGAQGQLQSRL